MAGGVGGGMGRLLGLGFVFGARDAGASRAAGNVAEGMDRVATSVEEAGRASSSLQRLGNAIGAISLAQLDRIGDSLEGLADRAGIDPSDTGLESFGVEFSNTWRRATVGLGPLRDQVEGMRGEISGLAYSLDIDANDMISAVTGIARSGNSLDDFGISLRTVAGSIQANILSGEQLATLLTGLSEGYELGTEGATRLVDRVTAVGEAFGYGADAVRRLPEIISAADPVLARFSGLSIEQVTDSVTRLSVAMSRGLGVSFEEGSQAAIELFNSLSEARAGLTDIVTGVGSDFPELATELGIAGGDIDEAMQSILSDPLTFATRMRDLMGTMDRSSPAFARLQGALANLPANFRFLITGGEEAGAALEAATQPVGEFEGAFNRMARSGAGTARTFSESMDRLRDRFETRLHRMTSITTSEVLGRQRQAYERLGNYLEDWSGRGGALGLLTQGFLNVRRYGLVHGLLPMLEGRLRQAFPQLADQISTFAPVLSDLGEGFLQVATSAGPMLVVLSQLGAGRLFSSAFGAIRGAGASIAGFLGPWGLLIAGIATGVGLIIYYWDDIRSFFETTDWAGMARGAAESFLDGLATLLDWSEQARDWIASVDWRAIGQSIGDGVRTAFEFVSNLFSGEFNGTVTQFFTDAFGMPPEQVFSVVVGTLRDILQNTLGQLDTIFHEVLVGIFGDDSGWVTLFDTLFAASPLGALQRVIDADNIADAFINMLGVVFGPAAALYTWIYDNVNSFWQDVFGESLIDSFMSIPSTLIGVVDTILGIMLWPFEQVFGSDRISQLFHQGGVMAIFEDFVDFVFATFEPVVDIWNDVIVPMGEIFIDVASEIGGAFSELWDGTVAPILDMLRDWWDDDFTESQDQAQQTIRSTGDSFRMMWQRYIRPALYQFIRMQADGIRRFREWIPTFQRVARFAVHAFFSITSAVRNFRTNFEGAREILARGWEMIGMRIRRFFTEPVIQAGNSFSSIFENIQMAVESIRGSFLAIVQSLIHSLQSAFNAIPEPLRSMMGIVGDTLGSAVSSIDSAVAEQERAVAAVEERIARAERERQDAAAARAAEMAAAEASYTEAVVSVAARAARDRAELAEEERLAMAGIDRFAERMDDSLGRAAERMGEIGTRAEDLGTAAPDVATVTSETGEPVATPVVSDEDGGGPPVVARTVEGETGAGTSTGTAEGATRGRARARMEAAAAAEEATGRERARDIAREMVISAFGPEAVRQLGTALARGGGPARRRVAAGGSGEEMGG